MANTCSAKKMIRKIAKRTLRNKARINRVRTFTKYVETAILTQDKDRALQAFRKAQAELDRAVTKRVLKKNTAARKIHRLSLKIKKTFINACA